MAGRMSHYHFQDRTLYRHQQPLVQYPQPAPMSLPSRVPKNLAAETAESTAQNQPQAPQQQQHRPAPTPQQQAPQWQGSYAQVQSGHGQEHAPTHHQDPVQNQSRLSRPSASAASASASAAHISRSESDPDLVHENTAGRNSCEDPREDTGQHAPRQIPHSQSAPPVPDAGGAVARDAFGRRIGGAGGGGGRERGEGRVRVRDVWYL